MALLIFLLVRNLLEIVLGLFCRGFRALSKLQLLYHISNHIVLFAFLAKIIRALYFWYHADHQGGFFGTSYSQHNLLILSIFHFLLFFILLFLGLIILVCLPKQNYIARSFFIWEHPSVILRLHLEALRHLILRPVYFYCCCFLI